MSLLIKGMDMPRNKGLFYDLLLSLSLDGSGEIFFNGKSYPITEIPSSHGRLIDADKLSISILKAMNNGMFDSIIGLIDKAPTIIEAEE